MVSPGYGLSIDTNYNWLVSATWYTCTLYCIVQRSCCMNRCRLSSGESEVMGI